MADKTIGELPAASGLDDDSLLVVEQQGTAMRASGALWKGFAQSAVASQVRGPALRSGRGVLCPGGPSRPALRPGRSGGGRDGGKGHRKHDGERRDPIRGQPREGHQVGLRGVFSSVFWHSQWPPGHPGAPRPTRYSGPPGATGHQWCGCGGRGAVCFQRGQQWALDPLL